MNFEAEPIPGGQMDESDWRGIQTLFDSSRMEGPFLDPTLFTPEDQARFTNFVRQYFATAIPFNLTDSQRQELTRRKNEGEFAREHIE